MKRTIVLGCFGAACLLSNVALGQGAADANKKYEKCPESVLLKGTVYAEGMPEWSQAQVFAPGLKGAQSFTLKKPWVATGMKLVEIGEGFITLEVGKSKVLQRCYTEKHVFTGVENPDAGQATSSGVSG